MLIRVGRGRGGEGARGRGGEGARGRQTQKSKKIQNYTPQHDIGGLHISGGNRVDKLFRTVFAVRDANACLSRFIYFIVHEVSM